MNHHVNVPINKWMNNLLCWTVMLPACVSMHHCVCRYLHYIMQRSFITFHACVHLKDMQPWVKDLHCLTKIVPMEGSHNINNTNRAGTQQSYITLIWWCTGRDVAEAENILHGHIKWLYCVVKVSWGEEECATVNFACSLSDNDYMPSLSLQSYRSHISVCDSWSVVGLGLAIASWNWYQPGFAGNKQTHTCMDDTHILSILCWFCHWLLSLINHIVWLLQYTLHHEVL